MSILKAAALRIPQIRDIWEQRSQAMAEVERLTKENDALLATLDERTSSIEDQVRELTRSANARHALFVPNDFIETGETRPFMAYSTCNAWDFTHPRYAEILAMLGRGQHFHRKVWEWVFIIHHLIDQAALRAGARGLAFGVGTEPLPALFARMGATVVATDAPPDIESAAGWTPTGQYGSSVDALRHDQILPFEDMRNLVSHRFCDMNNIDPELTGFDFNWSACCFEHLGDLKAGMDFVIESTEKTLRPGGIAVHTTELNLSSDLHTVESGETVLYRKSDIEQLVSLLKRRGHTVQPIKIAPSTHPLDFHVDVPPYTHNPHLKLRLLDYTTTSIGLVIQRGG